MKKESSKINRGLLITVIILITIIIGLICFIFTRLVDKKIDSPKEGQLKPTETEIKNIDIITDLSIKIDTLLSESDKTYHQTQTFDPTRYRFEILKQTLTNEEKQTIVLSNIKWSTITKETWEKAKNNTRINQLIKSYSETQVYETTKCVTVAEVNDYSKKLFGEEIDPKKLSRTSIYIYDETTNLFYFPEPQYGGTTVNSIKSYKSKYESKKDEAHVYVSFAFLSQTGTNSALDKFTIYKDFKISEDTGYKKVQYIDEYKAGLTLEEANDFSINSDNYKIFSEYKFIFKQDKNNNYYFTKVEQIK